MNTVTKHSTVGLKELRENMEMYITRLDKGETFTVLRRSTPVFKLSPIDHDDDEWEVVVDFVKETGKGMPLDRLLASMKKYGQKRKVS